MVAMLSMMEILMKKATVKDQSYSTIDQQPSKMLQKGSLSPGRNYFKKSLPII